MTMPIVEKREATGECHDVLITTSGEEIAFPEGYELTSFVYQDKIVVSYCFECEDEYSGIYYDFLYGLGTTNGEIYLRPQYDYISNFHEGYACIQIEHRWEHMDADGNIIVPPIYDLDEEEMGGAGYYFENGVAKLDSAGWKHHLYQLCRRRGCSGLLLIERHNGAAYAYVKYPWHP